ncbi:MAG TPA: hypothetical protein VGK74_02380 [Symbiobacteriaceae bacterium]
MIKTVDGVRTIFVRKDGFEWGYFFLNPKGLFVAHTDYGTYGYHWPVSEGWDFLKFLANARDMDYILGKISHRDHLDVKKTEARVQKAILQMRREKAVTKDRAKELWDDVLFTDDLMHWVMEQQEFCERDGYELAVMDFPPDARSFVRELFPILQAHLRDELAQKPAATA